MASAAALQMSERVSQQMIEVLLRCARSGYDRSTDLSDIVSWCSRNGRDKRVVQASLTRTLKRMEEKGLIFRCPAGIRLLLGLSTSYTKSVSVYDEGWEVLTNVCGRPIVNLLLIGAAVESCLKQDFSALFYPSWWPGPPLSEMIPPWLLEVTQ